MDHELKQRKAKLDRYVAATITAKIPEELQANLFLYGVVLVCGYIERSIEIIIVSRLTKHAQPRVLRFVKGHFKRGLNLDCEAIAQLLIRFDVDWHDDFRAFMVANDAVVEGVKAAYVIRNLVAHGGATSAGSKQLQGFAAAATDLIDGVVACTS